TCFDGLEGASLRRLEACIAQTVDLEIGAVRRALAPSGALAATGLMRLADQERRAWDEPLEVMEGLADILSSEHGRPAGLIARFCKPAAPAALGLDDFPHLAADVEILKRFLARAIEDRARGTNVLVYGAPGTGKTEIARAIAAALSASLFEVDVETPRGEP